MTGFPTGLLSRGHGAGPTAPLLLLAIRPRSYGPATALVRPVVVRRGNAPPHQPVHHPRLSPP
ncbi:predicted protein [Streptomyces sp. SPB78]|nr:predicted protein [Streptomyces sp. SPB78]